LISLQVCDSCGEENSDDVLVCTDCGKKLTAQNRKTKGVSKFSSKKVLLILLTVAIIFVGLYFSNFFGEDTTIEVKDPEILIESVTINSIDKDWLENNTWQVFSTVVFKILNSNNFDISITVIDFSIDLIDNGVPIKIYDDSIKGGLVPPESFLSQSETFWFLSDAEGVDILERDDLHFSVNGIAVFLVETSSSYQDGVVQFSGEV
jgi:hypothetical protein|tara:strand:+ start:239 stop:856 length:618 start_codon:yes stop_codon:yes gene_type:complete